MSDLETKAGGNVGAAFDDFMRAFEAFKETNGEVDAHAQHRRRVRG
jgi:hypothetical protein